MSRIRGQHRLVVVLGLGAGVRRKEEVAQADQGDARGEEALPVLQALEDHPGPRRRDLRDRQVVLGPGQPGRRVVRERRSADGIAEGCCFLEP